MNNMDKRMGTLDRTIRIAAGITLLGVAVGLGETWGYLGAVPLLTGAVGRCPIYGLFGISTCRKCEAK
jgi:hypothetical protein